MERRIAAILAADMVGYSRLIELDEAGILARQKRHRIELIDPAIARHNGRVVKLTGDGLIAEFGSVVEAVQCAVLVQREMVAREEAEPEDRRIRYRIGIHIGDVVFDDGDVYGDGVNIAARLEALADPGGIVVSGTAHDMLKAQVDVGYRPLGERTLKNIATPVRVFAVTDREAPAPRPRKPVGWRIPGAVLAVVVVAALAGFWWAQRPDFAPAQPDRLAFAIPEKPSIAVAPFDNIAGNPEVDWLTEGLSANVISALATSPDMVVISRNALSDMVGAGPAEIAERYGVRYVLDGTVQSDGKTLRVSARLADALEGRTLWAGKWDRPLDDVFAIQDEIADAILEELQVKLTLGEQARAWSKAVRSPEALKVIIAGRAAFQTFSKEGHATAERLWSSIYDKVDPMVSLYLQGALSWHRVIVGLSKDPVHDLQQAQRLGIESIDAGGLGGAHSLVAYASHTLGQPDMTLKYARAGLDLAPGEAEMVMLAGYVLADLGELGEGIDLMRLATRLEPDYPDWLGGVLTWNLMRNGQQDEARELAESILASDIKDIRQKPRALMYLAAMAEWNGAHGQAVGYIDNLKAALPTATRETVANHPGFGLPYVADRAYVERFLDALVAAGLPES